MTLAPDSREQSKPRQNLSLELSQMQSTGLLPANTTAGPASLNVRGQGYMMITISQPDHALTAEEYPVLAEIWDNDDDAIFDDL